MEMVTEHVSANPKRPEPLNVPVPRLRAQKGSGLLDRWCFPYFETGTFVTSNFERSA